MYCGSLKAFSRSKSIRDVSYLKAVSRKYSKMSTMELLFKLDVCEKTGICFRASEVNLPSGICLLQHLEPYGIRIFWCRKTEFLSLVGTTISLGPGRLQMKQRAWLVADEGSGRVTEGGLLAYLEELPCCGGENNVSFGAVSFFSMCFLLYMAFNPTCSAKYIFIRRIGHTHFLHQLFQFCCQCSSLSWFCSLPA